ncbi:MAG: hypothetical protein CMK06_13050 [Ponticaulis sp.]|nr:hypothetical protein [Ponticaulis sp.]
MSFVPAKPNLHAALSLDQIIGLFLAQLYDWLIRFERSGVRVAPHYIAQNVAKADALVYAFIRMRAAAKLERAGYAETARAMRTPPYERAEAEFSICAREPVVRIDQAQGHDGATPAELLSRLQITIENFERTEALATVMARMVVYTLSFLTPETREVPDYAHPADLGLTSGSRPSLIALMGEGLPYQWPPPSPPIPDLIWDPRLRTRSGHALSAKAWTAALAGVVGKKRAPHLSSA